MAYHQRREANEMRIDEWTTCLELVGQLTTAPLVLARPNGKVLAVTAAARSRLDAVAPTGLADAWASVRAGCQRIEISADDGPVELALLETADNGLRATLHDVRGALNAITLQLDLLRPDLDARGVARVDAAAREVRRMAQLLELLRGEISSTGAPPAAGAPGPGEVL